MHLKSPISTLNAALDAVFQRLKRWIFLCKGHLLADVSAILGLLDIVFGEVDR
ncbi:hypothetical protein [Bradyrhizobium sp. CCBAU 11357]|uniref:NADH-quinone oxidoreductase subunit D-related protein n=1 Tax=Bradyrhizobium sp. CCBAU 11357 TaxID=1630808 RepID=UPI002302AD49|nr:hypothetical protein [Bradyrhizobium sp. CCBAU 11357]